jgi:hypothetical protein
MRRWVTGGAGQGLYFRATASGTKPADTPPVPPTLATEVTPLPPQIYPLELLIGTHPSLYHLLEPHSHPHPSAPVTGDGYSGPNTQAPP